VTEVKHAILLNLDFLKALSFNTGEANKEVVLNLSDEDEDFAYQFFKANNISDKDLLITIHAGGGKFTLEYKCWPRERFACVADSLIKKIGAKILFIGGKDDEKISRQILGMMKYKAINATGKASLKQTAALIEKSRLLICGNSAPMHIGAALNIPTVSILGPVDSRIHGPWGKSHIVLQKTLECSPCYYPFFRDTLRKTRQKNKWIGKNFKCSKENYKCMTLVTVNDVIEAVEYILKKN